jgi:hypothetical protein
MLVILLSLYHFFNVRLLSPWTTVPSCLGWALLVLRKKEAAQRLERLAVVLNKESGTMLPYLRCDFSGFHLMLENDRKPADLPSQRSLICRTAII